MISLTWPFNGYCLGLTDIPLTVSPHFGFCDTSFSHLFVLIFKLLHWIVFFLPLRGRCPWGPILGPFLLIWTLLGSFICALVLLSHISTTNYQDHVRGEALCLDLRVLILSQASGHVPNCLWTLSRYAKALSAPHNIIIDSVGQVILDSSFFLICPFCIVIKRDEYSNKDSSIEWFNKVSIFRSYGTTLGYALLSRL